MFSPSFTDHEFKKSSFSREPGVHCVEVASGNTIAVRNSLRPQEATVHFTKDEWSAFISGVKNGEFDV